MQQKEPSNPLYRPIKMRYMIGTVVLVILIAFGVFFAKDIPFIASNIPSLSPKPTTSPIKTVFVIVMENYNWSDITTANAPYITNTLVPMGAHAEQYYNPQGNHPSLPNYLWMEAGTNFGVSDDGDPSAFHQNTNQHLATLLNNKGIPWKAYEEDISGNDCPLQNDGQYAVRHDPFVYFDDVTNNMDSQSSSCMQHIRPYTELAGDLQKNSVARYNFITPNLCDDAHDCPLKNGDTWLSHEVPNILNSQAYLNGGALFITWDEGEGKDGPIGLIALSPLAKPHYANTIHYTHSSLLRTLEEIFDVSPFLGDAANAQDLSDLFTEPLTKSI